MKSRAIEFLLAAAVVAALVACKTPDAARTSPAQEGLEGEAAPGDLEGLADRLRADLEKSGYEVAKGGTKLFTIDDCKYAVESVGNCYGNNPVAPYVFATLPLWPDEFADEAMEGAFGPTEDDTSATFRLDEREAIVVLAQLPPPGAYFGIQTYLYGREGAIDESDPLYEKVPAELRHLLFATTPNPKRALVFASMGNSNNAALVERETGSAFGQQRYFVITPDAAMDRAVREALGRAGVGDPSHVFTEPIPAELARLGLGPEADDFMTILRYAEPKDRKAGDAWRKELPLVVLRAREKDRSRQAEPYPTPAYDERSAQSELELADELEGLVEAVKQKWAQPDAAVKEFFSAYSEIDLVGQHCVGRPMNCLGDTQDTDTYRISPTHSIDGGEVIAVVGALATATGNATYTNLAVNRFEVLSGVANVSDPDLAGTAASFGVQNSDKFYVYFFSRDCTGIENCRELPTDLVPEGETIKIIQRNYIHPGTVRGADPEQLLEPWSIVLDGKAPR
ncbi:hypothetical protein [Vulgatibacter sp.]|uniref:hypothetical protein n=1 Tax=Vulgatibacter sp. TaxID=1971226 RepID=UPI0035670EF3